VLVTRLDSAGDVLLAGPAVRAVAASASVVVAAGPLGIEAARLLPGVDDVMPLTAPWVLADPPPVLRAPLERFVAAVADLRPQAAAILTSSHQSPLPLALLLRLAGVPRIAGISVDYPGSLLDHRIKGDPDVHEAERALAIVGELGFTSPAGDDGRLAVVLPAPPPEAPAGDFVVVHPGASAPARTLDVERWCGVVAALGAAGRRVVVTGSAPERPLTAAVAAGHPHAVDAGGRWTLGGTAVVLAGASAVVTGNTGPMHLAAAVGTPVVAVFAPTVPLVRWRPWRVAHEVLGDQTVPCAGCRSLDCPLDGQPCLAPVDPPAVVRAVDRLAGGPPVPQPCIPEEVR
jgi:ADP-heptose:LPS heptosyltransferase